MGELKHICPFCGGRMEGGNIFHLDRPCLTCTSCSLVIDEADADRRTPGPATAKLIRCIKADLEPTDKMLDGFLAEWAEPVAPDATPMKPTD